MILIIIIISLGQILLSYCQHIKHACTRAHEHSPTIVAVRWVDAPNHDGIKRPLFDAVETMVGRCFIQINNARATRYLR